MSFLKLNGSVGIVLVALALLVASSQIALAASTTLVCNVGNSQFTVDLNEAEGTATYNTPAFVNSGIPIAAYSTGPLPAKFDSKTVTFDQQTPNSNTTVYVHFTIDRVTGQFTRYWSEGAPFDQAAAQNKSIWPANCHVATAQF